MKELANYSRKLGQVFGKDFATFPGKPIRSLANFSENQHGMRSIEENP